MATHSLQVPPHTNYYEGVLSPYGGAHIWPLEPQHLADILALMNYEMFLMLNVNHETNIKN